MRLRRVPDPTGWVCGRQDGSAGGGLEVMRVAAETCLEWALPLFQCNSVGWLTAGPQF